MKTTHETDAEALYFRLRRSYLLRTSSIMDDYEMLREHYHDHPESFKVFNKTELLDIKRIQRDVSEGRHTLFGSALDLSAPTDDTSREKSDKNHRELVKAVIRNPRALEPFTGPINFLNTEHPVVFGSVDIVAQSGAILHAIEVKTHAAGHAIIGQLMKYYVGLSLGTIRRHYDEVRLIALCPGYDAAASNGLRQIGALPLLIRSNPLSISELH